MAALSSLALTPGATAMLPSVLSGFANTVGSVASVSAQRAAASYQASMLDLNAQMAERNAQGELMRGQREEQSVRLRTAQLKSSQRVALAANGLDLGQGTANDILTSTDVMGEIDANTVAANALRSAFGYRTQAMNFTNEARMRRASAPTVMGALMPTLLGTATSVSDKWTGLQKTGAIPKDADPWQIFKG